MEQFGGTFFILSSVVITSTTSFILISTFARIPSVISSTIAGVYFVEGNWKFGFIVYGIAFIITIIGLFIIRFFDKEKITKRALRELK